MPHSEQPLFSIILGYRERDIPRVRRCLESLVRQTIANFEILFIDYGSRKPWAQQIANLVAEFPDIRFFRTETQGWPWNRAKALNIGIRHARGDYIATTDIDLIFPRDFFAKLPPHVHLKRVLQCPPILLPEFFSDWSSLAKSAPKNFPLAIDYMGAFQCVSREKALKILGFNEKFEFWGLEDNDFQVRLKNLGVDSELLPEINACHQWHPLSQKDIPLNFLATVNKKYFEPAKKGALFVHSNGWGKIFQIEQRPILSKFPTWEETIDFSFRNLKRIIPPEILDNRCSLFEKGRGIGFRTTAYLSKPPILKTALDFEELLERNLKKANSYLRQESPFEMILLDITNRYRLNFKSYFQLHSLLRPGGILIIENLERKKPFTLNYALEKIISFLMEVLFPRAWRYSPTGQTRCREIQALVKNNLRDSILSVRHGNELFSDYYLDCLYANGTRAIFMK